MFVRIWITQLGIGLPDSGGAYSAAGDILDRIADAMAVKLTNSGWEGLAANASAAQGVEQWNSVTGLERIDQQVAAIIAVQADLIMATRKNLAQIETYLREMKRVAESLFSTGQVAEAKACEWTATGKATTGMNRAMATLNNVTAQHVSAIFGANQQLQALLAALISEGTPTQGEAMSAVNSESTGTLKRAASIFRVDLMSLKDVAAFCAVTKRWLAAPEVVAAGVSQRVGQTHGSCTAAFTNELQMFEIRRAEVIQKLRDDLAVRASLLEWTATNIELTDEETAALFQEAGTI